jgi:protein SCO1/2
VRAEESVEPNFFARTITSLNFRLESNDVTVGPARFWATRRGGIKTAPSYYTQRSSFERLRNDLGDSNAIEIVRRVKPEFTRPMWAVTNHFPYNEARMCACELRARINRLALTIAPVLLFVSACSHPPAAKRYELQGRVVAVDAAARTLTIAHQDVPGLMKGMTMPFTVSRSNEWVFRAIAPGDQIRATLVLSDHAELQDISFTKTADGAGDTASPMHIPEPGEEVPDFTLVNQDGRTIHLQQFRGKPLLLTFIYTRCPFPDYCLRMNGNFSAIMQQLQKTPQIFDNTQLLSISIDPKADTPTVLRTYGKRYVGSADPKFQHWQFATGSAEEVRKTADFFGLVYNQKDGQIVHSLSTVLIGKDGKVLRVYSGNTWKPEDVAADFAAAVGE